MSFKIDIGELREMVASAVRTVVTEKKQKNTSGTEVPQRSPESIAAQTDRAKRGLPGYQESGANDFSLPLGVHSVTKRQGASGMGGWTSEAANVTIPHSIRNPNNGQTVTCKVSVGAAKKVQDFCKQNGWKFEIEHGPADMVNPAQHGLDDPSELGMEARVHQRVYEMQVRKLVRMIVREEVRAARRR